VLPLLLGVAARPLTILCLGAHSDDIEIGVGGTLLRLLAERPGSSVHWVVFSASGERAEEARASAAAFAADAADLQVTLHEFRESHFPLQWEEIKAAFEALKLVQPDLVFSHRRSDEHQDHEVLGRLVWNTFRDQLIAEFEIPKYEGDLENPNVFVPLSEATAERKVALLLEHFASQRSRRWFRASTFRGLMAVRGVECNAEEGYAEAFHCRKIVL
jgi:LmbE family N-acetylglucosaminyl deacetylase